jgi:hypothetical protein
MSTSSVASSFRNYVDGLGGPRTDAETDPEFSVPIPPPPETAGEVEAQLIEFVRAVVTATNARFSGWLHTAGVCGSRDGAFAVPGHGHAEGLGLERPPFVNRVEALGESAMSEAEAIGEIFRSRMVLKATFHSKAAETARSKRRRRLHVYQLGLLVAVAAITTAGFAAIAQALNDWPNSSQQLTSVIDQLPTATSAPYLMAATFVVAALGITAGFFRAARERSFAKTADSGQAAAAREAMVAAERAGVDELVTRVWVIGLVLSAVIGCLLAIGGYFKLAEVSVGRMVLGLGVWAVWGAALFLTSALLTRISQHWLNLLPAEIDLTDYDHAASAQNEALATVGEGFVIDIVRRQHAFVVDTCTQVVDHYYEANLLMRNRSRTAELDSFAGADGAAVRRALAARAAR